ncbi:MAG TPA: ABC transporter permease subunit [Patescibacteria group bacterium]|nr:ABC transporter permease subunit [Patescibacteria group bacterium]
MKALLLARREIVEQYSDRAAIVRALLLVALPIVIIQLNRSAANAPDAFILIFALQAALLPAATAINAAAGSFAAEKEAQTLVPLLAAPIRDIEIVAGKLIGVIVPAAALSIVSLLVYHTAASQRFGATRIGEVLDPVTMAELFGLAVLFILTLGTWVMVVSARVPSQRAAQQIAGIVLAGVVVGLTGISSVVTNIPTGLIIGGVVAVLASDVIALQLAQRLWNREEAVARL